MKTNFLYPFSLFFISLFLLTACKSSQQNKDQLFNIIPEVVNNSESAFYIPVKSFPEKRDSLAVGVFDSGTGGLSVLDAIYKADRYNNTSHEAGKDGIPDFISEKFTYLADDANMPYGRYDSEGKADFLRELVIKDVNFLLKDNYYSSPGDSIAIMQKQPVKAIVIACNTATAYGLETVQEAVEYWGLDIKIMGIIDAGAKEVLSDIEDPENQLIAVLATEGTCSSGGYPRSISQNANIMFPGTEFHVIQQAGIGLAGAIDGDLNYIDPDATSVRSSDDYRGPDIGHPDYPVDTSMWKEYNFESSQILSDGSQSDRENALLCEYDEAGNLIHVQLNSVNNYIKYMVTNLYRNAVKNYSDKTISRVILGCTHYPYFEKEIKEHFLYLRENDTVNGSLVDENIRFINPSGALASELYCYLRDKELWGDDSNENSRFYISVPNILLKENEIDKDGRFPYDYKYGRQINKSLEYVKRVPFSDKWIAESTKERMRINIPYTYKMIYGEEDPQ